MNNNIRIAIAQLNLTVGDLKGNYEKIFSSLKDGEASSADIVAFPELAITGYPPEDLLLKNSFVEDNLAILKKIAKLVGNYVAIVGFVDKEGGSLYNAAAVMYKGEIAGIYRKIFLPNYSVFDEKRYFAQGKEPHIFKYGSLLFGVNICEDIWHEEGPIKSQAALGARLIVNINSSPYYAGKSKEREDIIKTRAMRNNVTIAYANLVGGQDELVFDGQSMIMTNSGKVIARSASFTEDMLITDIELEPAQRSSSLKAIVISDTIDLKQKASIENRKISALSNIAEIYNALLLGIRDYVKKNDFQRVVIGLSGGIDSAIVATLAVDALGRENVTGVFMPSRYSSGESLNDAKELATRLGIEFKIISIEQLYKIYLVTLEPHFAGRQRDIAEENLQARIRGNILMALSNKYGWLVLTTGNKSEMSTGYATLYGDMAGGLAVIKDVFKTTVYKLAKYRNGISDVIPMSVITKPPSAELKPDQKDSDTLPPYEKLDPILKEYIEQDRNPKEIIAEGFDREMVLKSVSLVDSSEYKRRQSPPGIKITPKAFGKDRRMPITNRYR